MAMYYNIKITGGTSQGPYTIYYDIVGSSNIATNFLNNQKAENLTLSQLSAGILVEVPDSTTELFLTNVDCKLTQNFNVAPKKVTYPCICVVIFDFINTTSYTIQNCYADTLVNKKPFYTGTTTSISWNNNGYWELSGLTLNNVVFRSNDVDNVPETNWYGVGISQSNYAIFAQTGTCASITLNTSYLFANSNDASCNDNDGSIYASALGGSGSWKYSIDGTQFQSTGIFDNLVAGQYLVTAKDSSNNTITELVDVSQPPITNFSIEPISQIKSVLNKVGNVQFYLNEITYDTSNIPNGVQITFDLNILYNLSYFEPGTVTFTTNQNEVSKNGVLQSITNTSTTPFAKSNPLDCNNALFVYVSTRNFVSPSVTLKKNDLFSIKLVYGIDTNTNGSVLGNCRTQGLVLSSISFENVTYTCDCCLLNNNIVTIQNSPQIYLP